MLEDTEEENRQLDPVIYQVSCGKKFSSYKEMKENCRIAAPDLPEPGHLTYKIVEKD